jgi:hypothetical protein
MRTKWQPSSATEGVFAGRDRERRAKSSVRAPVSTLSSARTLSPEQSRKSMHVTTRRRSLSRTSRLRGTR